MLLFAGLSKVQPVLPYAVSISETAPDRSCGDKACPCPLCQCHVPPELTLCTADGTREPCQCQGALEMPRESIFPARSLILPTLPEGQA